MRQPHRCSVVAGVILWLSSTLLPAATSPDNLWQSVDDHIPQARSGLIREIQPASFKACTLNAGQLQATLLAAPMEFAGKTDTRQPVEITLPKPDGSFERFRVEEVALMEPALAAKFPELRAYRGRGIDDPYASVQLDVNARTMHAQVLSPSGTYYVDPYWKNDGSLYMSYAKSALLPNVREFKCLVDGSDQSKRAWLPESAVGLNNENTGTHLRTYRLACATSATYSQYHGGTDPDVAMVLAALLTMNNRVSGVYENELGIRMVLVANQEMIIHTTMNPTPYTDSPGDIQTNPAFIDLKIGSENYDIGHVVTTGSGGVAGLGVVCRGPDILSGGSAKARGTTGINPPEGDGFWIDFVAHEMGHQFGGNHTFDGTGTNCGTNQNEATAYEPGSGTTIQAYAGICGDQDLAPHSDPFWHFISLVEMFTYASEGATASRPTLTLQRETAGKQHTPEATPGAGTLNPNPDESINWTGTATGVSNPGGEDACQEGISCDTFMLTLSGERADWEDRRVRMTFNWPGAADDYDIYVRKGSVDGPLVGDAASASKPEALTIDPSAPEVGTGVFAVRVVYYAVVPVPPFQYTATATVLGQDGGDPTPTCAVLTTTGNNPPTADAGSDYKIPARTPFALTATGTDPNGDPITYCWEEADLAPGAKDANLPDDGTNPIIRSYPPNPSPTRVIPRLQELLANQTQTRGEKLPTTTRELNFRVTVRDNKFGGWAMDSMKIDVLDSGTGFAVTSPNTAVTLPGGGTHMVTWDTANTTTPPISTTNVNIWLSTTGGNNYGTLLAANTPNDGSESVVLPFVNSTTARIKVEAVGNIYFDISNADFTIQSVDTDMDGIPDGYETANGLNPNDPADADDDEDGDGQNNLAEFIAGTNLNDPNSVLRIISIARSVGSAAVTFTSQPGKRYQIEASPNLMPPSWTPISGDIYPTGSTETYNDPNGGSGASTPLDHRFYRARVIP